LLPVSYAANIHQCLMVLAVLPFLSAVIMLMYACMSMEGSCISLAALINRQ
jgi:hypothetical protein